MREDGKQKVCIVGLQEYRVSNVDTIRELIEKGNATRSTGTTGANEESSRSHAILQLVIKKSVDRSESKPARVVGKLSFIDLAGSERGADTTDNDKQTRYYFIFFSYFLFFNWDSLILDWKKWPFFLTSSGAGRPQSSPSFHLSGCLACCY